MGSGTLVEERLHGSMLPSGLNVCLPTCCRLAVGVQRLMGGLMDRIGVGGVHCYLCCVLSSSACLFFLQFHGFVTGGFDLSGPSLSSFDCQLWYVKLYMQNCDYG